MTEPISAHPLLAPFWRREGVRHSKVDSLTLNDFSYTLRLEEDRAAVLEEREYSYFDSGLLRSRVVKGRWEPIRVEPKQVVLRISGVNEVGAPSERILILLPDEVFCGDGDWWRSLRKSPEGTST